MKPSTRVKPGSHVKRRGFHVRYRSSRHARAGRPTPHTPNRIAAIPNALHRQTPFGGGGVTVAKAGFLNNPLGLTIAPNGDILTANANDGNIVETTPFGAEFQPFETAAGGGGLFGLTVSQGRPGVYFINDAENTLDLLH